MLIRILRRFDTWRLAAWAAAFGVLNAAPAQPAPAGGIVVYVSPAGDDAWSGRAPAPNPARTDGPFATIQRAQEFVRRLKAKTGRLPKPVAVVLRGGAYRLTEPLVFTPADSGTKDCPVSYEAWPGEKPVISGGRPIRGWRRDEGEQSKTHCAGRLWRAPVPRLPGGKKWRFNQLFVNGQRRVRARIPNPGAFFRTDGPVSKSNRRAFYFRAGDVKRWRRLREVLFVVYHSWETSLHHVHSVDFEAGLVTFREPAPWPMGRWERRQRYYVENVFEGLDQPGEWYLDSAASTLYYYPLPGEDPRKADVVAPTLTSTLVSFKGDAAKGERVEHLRFRGLAFQHTNANLRRFRNPGQGEIYQPALIMAAGLRDARFIDCEAAHTGAHAFWFAGGCERVLVQHCHIHDLGGGGVYIGGGWGVGGKPPAARIVVDNNFIHDGGHLFHGAHGVWIGRSSYNQVTHNEISNFDYSGVSCGWSWGFQPTTAHHNHIDYNHIHHLGNGDGLSDMGGIYTLGVSPGTTERYNCIHHVYNYAHVSHGSGIYPDEGSSNILIENNIVYRVRTCPLFQHYGAENIVRNNILAFGGKGQLQRCREDRRCHFDAEGNIVYADIREMLAGVWRNGDWKLGRNVYWSTAGPPTFKGMDFETWRVKARDVGSIVADPRFVDAEHGDFRLRPDSPALKLGFKPIDRSQIGLYGDQAWRDLPKKYPNRPLNEIPAPPREPFVVNFDFESDAPGAEPLDGKIVKARGQAILVSTDTAAAGAQSLKFIDAPGAPHNWTPHIYYRPTYSKGEVQVSWDMLNSKTRPASFYVEVRQWDVHPYRVGPTVSVSPDGKVTASGRPLGAIPLGEWAHVDIRFELGPGAAKTYRITLRAPARPPVAAEIPFRSPAFEKVTWFGVSSTSDAASVFYIDNLKLGTPEELKAPPKHRRHRRRRRPRPQAPPNPQKLAAYWSFDEGEGTLAADRSGCKNHGDVWARWAKGAFGSALYCDEEASVAIVPDSPTLQFGKSDFTIELWICPVRLAIASKDARRRFMSKNQYPRTWWCLNITREGTPYLEMTDDGRHSFSARPHFALPEGRWSHFAVVVDRAHRRVRYYVNGEPADEIAIPPAFTGALDVAGSDLSIGCRWHPFIGLLDEVKIYKRARSAAEIRADYEKEKGRRASARYKVEE